MAPCRASIRLQFHSQRSLPWIVLCLLQCPPPAFLRRWAAHEFPPRRPRLDVPGLKAGQLSVLMAICRHAHSRKHNCCMSRDIIAAQSRMTARQVTRIVPTLVKAGYITVVSGRGRASSVYTVQVDFIKSEIAKDRIETRQLSKKARETASLRSDIGLVDDQTFKEFDKQLHPKHSKQRESDTVRATMRGRIFARYEGIGGTQQNPGWRDMATWAAACCSSSRRWFRSTHLGEVTGSSLGA